MRSKTAIKSLLVIFIAFIAITTLALTACSSINYEVSVDTSVTFCEGHALPEISLTDSSVGTVAWADEDGVLLAGYNEYAYIITLADGETKEGSVKIEAYEHVPTDEGLVLKEATYLEDGIIQYTCAICGEKYTESIPKLSGSFTFAEIADPNNPENTVTASACSTTGYSIFDIPHELDADGNMSFESGMVEFEDGQSFNIYDDAVQENYGISDSYYEDVNATFYANSIDEEENVYYTIKFDLDEGVDGVDLFDDLSITGTDTLQAIFTWNKSSDIYKYIKHLQISDYITSLPHYAFYGCTSLETVSFPDSFNFYEDEDGTMGGYTIGAYAFGSCTSLTSMFTLPEGVDYVGNGAFMYCQKVDINKLIPTIGATVEHIGLYAFFDVGHSGNSVDLRYINDDTTFYSSGGTYVSFAVEDVDYFIFGRSTFKTATGTITTVQNLFYYYSTVYVEDYYYTTTTAVVDGEVSDDLYDENINFDDSTPDYNEVDFDDFTDYDAEEDSSDDAMDRTEAITHKVYDITYNLGAVPTIYLADETFEEAVTVDSETSAEFVNAGTGDDALSLIASRGSSTSGYGYVNFDDYEMYLDKYTSGSFLTSAPNTTTDSGWEHIIDNYELVGIGNYTMGENLYITEVTIPNTCTYIGRSAFEMSSNLSRLYIEPANGFSSDDLSDQEKMSESADNTSLRYIMVTAFADTSIHDDDDSTIDFVFPKGLVVCNSGAFYHDSGTTKLNVYWNAERLYSTLRNRYGAGNTVYYWMSEISVELGPDVTYLTNYVFNSYGAYYNYGYKCGPTSIDFSGATGLASNLAGADGEPYYATDTVIAINAFYNASVLTSIDFTVDGTTDTINIYTSVSTLFKYCSRLTSINFGNASFYYYDLTQSVEDRYYEITDLDIDDTSIFYSASIKSVLTTLDLSGTSIESVYGFSGFTKLSTVTLPSTVLTIKEDAFDSTAITTISTDSSRAGEAGVLVIPANCTIEDGSFDGCTITLDIDSTSNVTYSAEYFESL